MTQVLGGGDAEMIPSLERGAAVKKALITGITGQDGSYLAELLLAKGYEVFGVIRRSSSFNTGRIDQIYEDPHVPEARLRLVFGDLNDASSLNRILRTIQPDEIYNLGAQSHVRVSFDIPEYTGDVTGLGTVRLLEAIREVGLRPKFYQASSSEMFGKVQEIPQRETTPFSSFRAASNRSAGPRQIRAAATGSVRFAASAMPSAIRRRTQGSGCLLSTAASTATAASGSIRSEVANKPSIRGI